MMDSPQHQTTLSTSVEEEKPRYPLSQNGWKIRADPELLLAKVMARQYGTIKVLSGVFWKEQSGRSRPYVTTRCDLCGVVKDRMTENLLAGKILTCKCNPRKFDTPSMRRLADRYYAIQQRCSNPNCPVYQNYGGRGIQNYFTSPEEFVSYVIEHLPHPDYFGLHIDRADNNGHYEPGNLRLVIPSQNAANTRRNVLVEYLGITLPLGHLWHLLKTFHPEFPYTKETVRRLVMRGVPIENLVNYRRPTPGGRKSTTLSMPDPAIVSLYLGR
jgi:hypothetical protein